MKNLAPHQVFLLNRASQDEGYLAHTLLAYAKAKGNTWPDLLDELKCGAEDLLKLALCKNLKGTEPNYAGQLQQVATYAGMDAVILSGIIKRTAFLSVVRPGMDGSSSGSNYLAAAREKDADKDKSPEEKS